MQLLRQQIIPDLLAKHWNDHTLRLWSAGCATGEEAYTLAILLKQAIPDIDRWKISILATDINKHALEKARRGYYRRWSFRQQSTDDPILQTFFTRDQSGYQLQSSIIDMVKFASLNLSDATFPSAHNNTEHLDLILCRNVTMYLSAAVIQKLAGQFYECLLPDGWLMLGASENNDQVYHQFKTRMNEKTVTYQKELDSPSSSRKTITASTIHPYNAPLHQLDPVFNPTAPDSAHIQPAANVTPQQAEADSHQNLFQSGMVLIKEHKFEEAKKCLWKYLIEYPQDVEAQYQLAFINANSGHLEEAQQMARRIIDQAPLFSKAYAILALVYQEKDELNLAVSQLKKVLYLDPDDLMANFNLAIIFQKQGLSTEASRYRQQAIKLASKLQAGDILPGTDNISVADFLNRVRT
jgi:chemotaxis protein methyltransferase CheR